MPATLASAQDTTGTLSAPAWLTLSLGGLAVFVCVFLIVLWPVLRKQEGRAAIRILEGLGHGVALFDADDRLIFANKRARAIRPVLGAASVGHIAAANDASGLDSLLTQAASASGSALVVKLENGRRMEAEVTALPGGEQLLVLGDVSAEQTDEDPSAERMAALQEELNRSHLELDNFAHVASHDLKEPLRGLSINANFLLREQGLSDGGRDRVARMMALCNRMEQLISDLLFFSRLSRSGSAREDVETSEIINAIRVSLTELLDERSGTISIATELPRVHGESAKIKTVFQNLIVNAIKYNDALRKVVKVGFLPSVETEDETLHDVFYVSDNGIGIDEINRDKIFRIFSRLNTEKAYGAGTGAGLAFVKKIVEDYGGEITFASNPGKGTTFYFSLPISTVSEVPPLLRARQVAG